MPDREQELLDYLKEGEEVMLTISRTALMMLSKEVADFVANLKYPNSERARMELIEDFAMYMAELWSQIEAIHDEQSNSEPEE